MMLSQMLRTISLTTATLILLSSAAFSARILSVTTCESVSGEAWIPVNVRDSFTGQVPEINTVIDIDGRNQDLRQMFTSFGFGQGKNDPALIGTWDLLKTVSITNQSVWETDWSRAQAVSKTSSRLSFQPDGTWTRNDQSHALVGASGIWLEDKSNDNSQGIWNAGDGILYMLW